MANINQLVDKDYEGMNFQELADCPVAALQGLSEGDADAPKQASASTRSASWPTASSSASPGP